MIEPLPLAKDKKGWFIIIAILTTIFLLNILYEYIKFKDFKAEEIYTTKAQILKIYPKINYKVLKLQSSDITFFTSTKEVLNFKKLQFIDITIVTKKITFIEYIKGFYALSFNINQLKIKQTNIDKLSQNISAQHQNKNIGELFNALFFAIPASKEIKDICAIYGVSHLIAISGFHLGVLSFVLYWILYIFYTPIKRKYFPYRNTKFDLLIFTSIFLFAYLLFLGLVPSLLRAFIMFIFGIFFLRSNIKILSFQTLALVVMLIIAVFPKLLFSLSLWFSVAGVFYIFLFLQYFKNLNKIAQFFLFNIWIYLVMNPVTHFFFGTLSIVQLYSPIFTIGFSLFYPLELFLHIINYGNLFDSNIISWVNSNPTYKDIFTPLWVFIPYIIISFLSINYISWFKVLNISFVVFNLWLFLS